MAESKRFHLPTGDEISDLLSLKDSENTKKSTLLSIKCLRDFIAATAMEIEIESCPKEVLDDVLKKFYVGARKTNGERFKKTALQNIRYGIKRYMKDKRGCDILSDPEFCGSNEVFKAEATDLKSRGLENIEHHPPISENDLRQLYSGSTHVFDTTTPYGLQKKVWFEITLFLCRRGRENIRFMTKDTFKIMKDDTGRQSVNQHIDELDKNHRADTQGSVTEGRMYEIPGNSNCPVVSFKKYIEKFSPDRNDLWQRPRDTFNQDDDVWYMNSPVGKNTLSQFMMEISKVGKLSREYRNHSVRATSITVMDIGGISGRHIMKVSGHKSKASLKSYSHFVSDKKKREISDTLSSALGHKMVSETPQLQDLGDLSDVFKDDFELEPVNVTHSKDIQNILSEISQNNMNTQNKVDVSNSSGGFLNFRPTFSDRCNVTININFQK
ncbi:uncharacterized protein LOC134236784 [Saccostrea cucullata]|uniref:uncharacterized protein LOC134236784 n=1 Tax=Saccostrea cuccullata TaxID=36930 RepID=UPI002ED1D386